MTETTVIEKLAVALVGTEWGLEQYLVESLEEDPWKFLVRVVTEGLEQEGLFKCCECGVWTYDLWPGPNVCPKCEEGHSTIVGRARLHELTVALETEALHPDLYIIDPELLEQVLATKPHVLPLVPDPHISHDQTTTLPGYPEGEGISTALDGIRQETDPATATMNWDDPRLFANWATGRLFAALETEVKQEGDGPCQ